MEGFECSKNARSVLGKEWVKNRTMQDVKRNLQIIRDRIKKYTPPKYEKRMEEKCLDSLKTNLKISFNSLVGNHRKFMKDAKELLNPMFWTNLLLTSKRQKSREFIENEWREIEDILYPVDSDELWKHLRLFGDSNNPETVDIAQEKYFDELLTRYDSLHQKIVDPDFWVNSGSPQHKMLPERIKWLCGSVEDIKFYLKQVREESLVVSALYPRDFEMLKRNNIWEKVMEYMTHPSDMTSAYFACETFAEYVEHRRKKTSMEEVLKILEKKHFHEECTTDMQIIRNLRLVSKGFKTATDHVRGQLLENPQFTFEDNEWYLNDLWSSIRGLELESEEDVDSAVNILNVNANAELPGLLELDWDHLKGRSPFLLRLFSFLDVYGSRFWGLKFFAREEDTLDRDITRYDILRDVLFRVPRLRILHLLWDSELEETREMAAKFKKNVLQNPLEEMPSLELIVFDFGDYRLNEEGKAVAEAILSQTLNLKSLQFEINENGVPDYLTRILRTCKLERFEVKISDVIGIQFSERKFYSVGEYDWPLKVLSLQSGSRVSIRASDLFCVLSKFNDSLGKVTLKNFNIINYYENEELRTPKLSSMKYFMLE